MPQWLVDNIIKIYSMFIDTEFEDLAPTPTQFPKTDMNFYMVSYNTSALQPWNKTTYKSKAEEKHNNHSSNLKTMKRRNLSYDLNDRVREVFLVRKRSVAQAMQCNKNKLNLTTLTFCFDAESSEATRHDHSGAKKRISIHSPSKARKFAKQDHVQQRQSENSENMFGLDEVPNYCKMTNTLRHTNLLKLKQEHQNKVLDVINKREMHSKGNIARLNRFERLSGMGKHMKQAADKIILADEPRIVSTHDVIRKPRKVSYIGIRKFMQQNAEKQY